MSAQHARLGQDSAEIIIGLYFGGWDVFTPGNSDSYAGCHIEPWSAISYEGHDSCFTLDHFSDDQTRVFFKCRGYTALKATVFRRLHEEQLIGDPILSIQVRAVVNDTGLPDILLDDKKEEISFDWKGMLDQLMGEEHVFNTIVSQRLGWHLENDWRKPLSILQTLRRLARRSRLQREYRAKYGSNILDHYTRGEGTDFIKLDNLRVAAMRGHRVDLFAMYPNKEILGEFPDNTIIYSENADPGPKSGSIPRPLPEISWGQYPVRKY